MQALERAIKTAAQAASALLVGEGVGLLDINWGVVGSIAGLAALASVLSSIVTSGVGQPNSPSAVKVTAN
jgi:hypothetical protein